MRYAFLLGCIFLSNLVYSQDISGIWRGTFKSSNKFMEMFNAEDSYKIEVQIDQADKKFQGVTYSYKTTVFYGKAVAKGTVNSKTGKVYLEELKIVEVKMMDNSYACIMIYKLQYSKNNDEEFLEGTYSSFRENDSSSCGKGTVYLRKVTTSDFYKEPFLAKHEKKTKPLSPVPQKSVLTPPVAKSTKPRLPGTTGAGKSPTDPQKKPAGPPVAMNKPKPPAGATPGKTSPSRPGTNPSPPVAKNPGTAKVNPGSKNDQQKPLVAKSLPERVKADTSDKNPLVAKKAVPVHVPRVLTTRENEVVKTITLNSNDVSINIYDNGTIDHDTVSVYLDKKLVVSKQMLTTAPITVSLKLDEANPFHELVMVAENLGDIPPNTSLMVVKAGDKSYEVRITSTEQKNAVIIFQYEKVK